MRVTFVVRVFYVRVYVSLCVFAVFLSQRSLPWSDEKGERKMAEHDPKKVTAILKDYEEALETLTFNSKPLINDLTMAADRYTPLAPQIVAKIESRLFEVFTSSLYFFVACMPYLILCSYFGKVLYQLREMLIV